MLKWKRAVRPAPPVPQGHGSLVTYPGNAEYALKQRFKRVFCVPRAQVLGSHVAVPG